MVNKAIYVNAPSIFYGRKESKYFSRANSRDSHPKVFYQKGVLRFTGKHLCRNLYFIRVAGLQPLAVADYKLLVSSLLTLNIFHIHIVLVLPLLISSK